MRKNVAIFVGLCFLPGCSRAVTVANYAPADTARAAITAYDKNGDGVLDATELKECPALNGFAKRKGLKKLEAADLESELRAFQDGTVGAVGTSVRVMKGGRPLEGARVTLVPEKFHGSTIRSASGVTDKNGSTQPEQEGGSQIGVAPGFYRIEVSLKNPQGVESLAAKYNAATELGDQVHTAMRGGIVIALE